MARSIVLMFLVVAGSFGWVVAAKAQSPVLAELYGRGVHAYNSGNLLDAHRYLSMAIENGSRDPRAYYFRGVVNATTGRQPEAEEDWQTGAELEARGEFGLGIGRSLQRIQGSVRMEMENVRQLVRLEMRAQQSSRNQARYNELKAAESEVLRGGAAPPQPTAPAPVPPTPSQPPAAAQPAEVDDTNNPFGNNAADPAQPIPDSQNDPFADDPAAPMEPSGATPATGDDPFGGGAAPAADDPFGAGGAPPEPAAPQPAAPAADPFAPAGGDPFGAPAAGAGGEMSDPFGGGGDPFGT